MPDYPFIAEAARAGFHRCPSPRPDTVKYQLINDTINIKYDRLGRVLEASANGKRLGGGGRAAVLAWFEGFATKCTAPADGLIDAPPQPRQARLDRVLSSLRELLDTDQPQHRAGCAEHASDPTCAACWYEAVQFIVNDAAL